MVVTRPVAAKVVMLIAALALLPACASPASTDFYRWESTVDSPKTIQIVQSMTDGHVLWEMEIPVQHTMTMDLNRRGEFDHFSVNPNNPATSFRWALFDDRGRRYDFGRESLPGLPVRLHMVLRDSPEWPPNYTPPTQAVEQVDRPAEREPRQPLEIEQNGPTGDPEDDAPAEE